MRWVVHYRAICSPHHMALVQRLSYTAQHWMLQRHQDLMWKFRHTWEKFLYRMGWLFPTSVVFNQCLKYNYPAPRLWPDVVAYCHQVSLEDLTDSDICSLFYLFDHDFVKDPLLSQALDEVFYQWAHQCPDALLGTTRLGGGADRVLRVIRATTATHDQLPSEKQTQMCEFMIQDLLKMLTTCLPRIWTVNASSAQTSKIYQISWAELHVSEALLGVICLLQHLTPRPTSEFLQPLEMITPHLARLYAGLSASAQTDQDAHSLDWLTSYIFQSKLSQQMPSGPTHTHVPLM